jgi:tRNA (guanine37-N1)-methyltransferase
MRRLGVITLFPEMLAAVTGFGVSGRALRAGLVAVRCWNPRDFATDRHRSVDDNAYGGGPGMVMMVEPLRSAIRAARAELPAAAVIYLSPQGRRLDQGGVAELAGREELILVAGRYEGIDERLLATEIDEEWSIGDYVLSGGELAAMVLIDAIVRLLPGALGDADSAQQDSFMNGLLDCPHYTRPEEIDGLRVPDVLLSGNHARIAEWRRQQALLRTWRKRPDLLRQARLGEQDRKLLDEMTGGGDETR